MADPTPDEPSRGRQKWTFYIACAALAIAVGHVIYAFLRDHVFDY
ncbi:MAG: hypothetical protein CM1200mP22_32880 [Dehalococcoidia bacterium]|nr:hypothetical protein [Chloroflexota bacterium]GIS96051.1 MAG: hypothetical protein CM1200mP22_32880 [Dehalococcoidia bacterium]